MKNIDVFNGDADGICALLQLHLSQPERINNQLITGVKRDINLLKKVPANTHALHITVLDISLDKNRLELQQLLDRGFSVFYADHHFAGDFPEHPNLQRYIDTKPDICTSLIINKLLNHDYYRWAITGAYGDNMNYNADQLAIKNQISDKNRIKLNNLGTYLNYNAYGTSIKDLHFNPEKLFQKLVLYSNPLDFINDPLSEFSHLEYGFQEDMLLARKTKATIQTEQIAVYILDDASWARRVNGVWSNELVNQFPQRAHAVITHNKEQNYTISVRAPLLKRFGADELCRQFPSGGGRKAAAGINQLPKTQLEKFIKAFESQYS